MTITGTHECLFCTNKGKLTKEHIFGDSLSRALNISSKFTRHDVGTGDQWSKGRLERQGGVLGATLQCVCGDRHYRDGRQVRKGCNGTWMGAIQQHAKPLILELNETGLRQLDEVDTLKLALWVTTVVMVLDAAHPPTQVIPRHVRHAYGSAGPSRCPPDGWQIFAAPYDDPQRPDFFWHRAIVFSDPKTGLPPEIVADHDKAQLTTFAVGNILLHAFSHMSDRVNISPSLYGSLLGLQPIWPTKGLPRNVRFTAADVRGLMDHGPNFWVTA